MKYYCYFNLLIIILCISCNKSNLPKNVSDALKESGINKEELQKVINHYNKSSNDTLKLKATYFLISNLKGRYYYQGKLLSNYMDYLKLIRQDKDHGLYVMKSLTSLYGPFSIDDVPKKYDLTEVKSDDLIENIDMSFKVWKEQPWLKKLSFQDFCEYILPFRIADEVPAYNRKQLYEKFNPILDSVRKSGGGVVEAGVALNESLARPEWLFSVRTSFLPHFNAADIIKYRFGSCREMVDLAIYTMRAAGIPVGRDFVPQWPYRDLGHEWNTLLDSNGKTIMFLGSEDDPGTPHKLGTKKGKVFRQTFAINTKSLAYIKDTKDIVPSFLNDSRIKDVTDQYVKCFNVTVSLFHSSSVPEKNKKYAYIAVFNNHRWIPVDWGIVKNNKVTFTKMEGDIAYLVGFFDRNDIAPAAVPFILTKDGRVNYLNADTINRLKQISISRIFPVTPDNFDLMHLSKGKFQGANQIDFKDATDLYEIPKKPFPFWNEVNLPKSQEYRFVRFFSSTYASMGELEFYSKGIKLEGKAFGSKSNWYKDKTFDKAFDSDIFSYFDPAGFFPDTTRLGIDLGIKKAIDKIRFLAPLKEDIKVKIQKGHMYNLYFWNNQQWTSVGKRVAQQSSINFENLPSKTLYLLFDETANVDERIFTIKNGNQVWW